MGTRFFRHYKNKPYRYHGIVRHSETLEELVLYETLYDNAQGKMWVRPKEMFFEKIILEGKPTFRFQPVQFQIHEANKSDPDMLPEIYKVAARTLSDLSWQKFESDFSKINNPHCLVGYDNAKVVGYKIGYALENGSFYSWIGGVMPEYQGLGIASQLMITQHQWCRDQGFKVIVTKSKNKFPQMISLNLKHGFQITGTEIALDGSLKILFQKPLDI